MNNYDTAGTYDVGLIQCSLCKIYFNLLPSVGTQLFFFSKTFYSSSKIAKWVYCDFNLIVPNFKTTKLDVFSSIFFKYFFTFG